MDNENKNILIACLGNDYRQDDGVGHYVLECLQDNVPHEVTLHAHGGEGIDLIERWKNAKTAIVIDAVSSGGQPGKLYRFELPPDSLPKDVFCCSTHAFSIASVIQLAESLGQLPDKVIIYGIEGKTFEQGKELSCEALQGGKEAINCIREDIELFMNEGRNNDA